MKQKILALTLVLSLSASLVACSTPASSSSAAASSSVAAESVADTSSIASTSTTAASDAGVDKVTSQTLEEMQASGKTYYYSDGKVIDAAYFVTEEYDIVVEDGVAYFDFTADELIAKTNEIMNDYMTDPAPYQELSMPAATTGADENILYYVNKNGMMMLVETTPDKSKVANILVAGTSSMDTGDSSLLSYVSTQTVPVMCAVDPNMIPRYANLAVADIAGAGMITYTDEAYAYDTKIGQIGYGVIQIPISEGSDEDLLAVVIGPLTEVAED